MGLPHKKKNQKEDVGEGVIKDVNNSGCFGKSKRQLQLFKYLINNSLAGKSSSVTQYSIALDVIGRSDSFDPNVDSIVRVEMHRLRANLDAYNIGKNDYLITVPPASFQVLVKKRKQSIATRFIKTPSSIAATAALMAATFCMGYVIPKSPQGGGVASLSAGCSKTVPNISVNNAGTESDVQLYADRVIRSTIAQQTGFNLLNSGQGCGSLSVPSFNVEYSLVEQADMINVVISVVSVQTGNIISSYHLIGDVAEMNDDWDLYYGLVKIANSISMPDSLLARAALTEAWSNDLYRDNYRCVTDMYDSFSGGADEDVESVQQCLQDAYESEYASLDNHGALAASYLEMARYLETAEAPASFKLAEKIIGEQQDFWFESAELAIAKLYYEIQRPDFNGERLNSILSDMEVKYSTNPQVLLMVAWLYGYSMGDWEKAKNISEHIKLIYTIQDQSVFTVDAGYALMHLDGNELMEDCTKFYAENSVYMNVIINACARKAKDADWFKITEKNLSRLSALNTEQKMVLFRKLKHNFIFSKKVRTLLESPSDI